MARLDVTKFSTTNNVADGSAGQFDDRIVGRCKKDMSTVCILDTRGEEREPLGLTTIARLEVHTRRGRVQNGGIAGAGRRHREKK